MGELIYGGRNVNRRFSVDTHIAKSSTKSGAYDGHIAILKLETYTA